VYSGYYLQDCSGWLKDQVASDSYWHKISSCTRDSKVCGKMRRSINGIPKTKTVDLPGHNFPHPSLSHPLEPLLLLPKSIQKPHLKRKKKISPGLVRVRPGHGSTRRVDRVLPGCCISRSFNKPEPVQPPGFGSTRRSGPGLITLIWKLYSSNMLQRAELVRCKSFSKENNKMVKHAGLPSHLSPQALPVFSLYFYLLDIFLKF